MMIDDIFLIERRRALERMICKEEKIRILPKNQWPSDLVYQLEQAVNLTGQTGFVGAGRNGVAKLVLYNPSLSKQAFKQGGPVLRDF